MLGRDDGSIRHVCYVTGTRAEFGLMRRSLQAIAVHPRLRLQLIVTGMHLDRRRGASGKHVLREEWLKDVDRAVIPWRAGDGKPAGVAEATGRLMASIPPALERLQSDIVLVCGDRVEAFAGAAAGHVAHRIVAHVHGGDRAAGQVDDALRHAITKLAHVHFPATRQSAQRLLQLGEDRWRIHRAGSPGIDGITRDAAPRAQIDAAIGNLRPHRYALLLLHPVDASADVEYARAQIIARTVAAIPFERVVVVYPNNDPGSGGILRAWEGLRGDPRFICRPDVPRSIFLGLLRDAGVLVGNSSSGIIEAASFRTPVVDIGPRQEGRERGDNVINVPYRAGAIRAALERIWNRGTPRRSPSGNPYGGTGTAARIAHTLATLRATDRLMHKLIAY